MLLPAWLSTLLKWYIPFCSPFPSSFFFILPVHFLIPLPGLRCELGQQCCSSSTHKQRPYVCRRPQLGRWLQASEVSPLEQASSALSFSFVCVAMVALCIFLSLKSLAEVSFFDPFHSLFHSFLLALHGAPCFGGCAWTPFLFLSRFSSMGAPFFGGAC